MLTLLAGALRVPAAGHPLRGLLPHRHHQLREWEILWGAAAESLGKTRVARSCSHSPPLLLACSCLTPAPPPPPLPACSCSPLCLASASCPCCAPWSSGELRAASGCCRLPAPQPAAALTLPPPLPASNALPTCPPYPAESSCSVSVQPMQLAAGSAVFGSVDMPSSPACMPLPLLRPRMRMHADC